MTAAPFNPLDPYPWYAERRKHTPVVFNPDFGAWMVYRYGDVQHVLSTWKDFSSQQPRGNGSIDTSQSSLVILTDPPRHRQLRALVEQAFTPRQVRALAPRIEELVDELLGKVEGNARMDFIHDFAEPLPIIVIAEMLGVPSTDRLDFKRWSDGIMTDDATSFQELNAYLATIVEQRRQVPEDDLISGLLAAQVEGEQLDIQGVLGFCVLLLVAGNETTTNLLGNTVLSWRDAPEAHARVLTDRELLPSTIEEALRYRSPIQALFRTAVRDVELGGVLIPAGSQVSAWIGSANRDEAQFERPDLFDPARSPNRHLAFGNGIHFCMGAPLARLEASIALGAVLDRLPRLRVESGPLTAVGSIALGGVKALPVRWD